MPEQGRTSRGAKLPRYPPTVDWGPLQDMGGGRRWNRENAVCTADRSTADMDRGDDHLICADQVKQQTTSNDVRNRV